MSDGLFAHAYVNFSEGVLKDYVERLSKASCKGVLND